MFRKTDPQRKLFGVETNLPSSLVSRLRGSWAEIFRNEVLEILLRSEEDFAALYGITGRPNFSVARILGLCFLQELNRLSDQEALDAFGFDARWQYALDVTGEEAYLSRRSLVEFRSRMVRVDPEMALMRSVFNRICQTAIDKLGISTSEQRVDSTHIQSNIHTKGRLALFVDVIDVFLKSLDEKDYNRVPGHIRKWHERESNGWFGMGDAAERKAKVGQLAMYMHRLLECFSENKEVKKSEAYALLRRLFEEQCEVIERQESPGTDDENGPADKTDASLSESETSTTELEEVDLVPQKMFVDGGYPTVESAYEIIEHRGVELMAPVNRGPMDAAVMGRDRFEFDDAGHVVSCPEGHPAIGHKILSNNSTEKTLHAIFDGDTCRRCDKLETCPVRAPNHRKKGQSPRETTGHFRLEITPELRLRDDMLVKQQTGEWKDDYKIRSGVEATMSEMKRGYGMARLRVRGLARVHFAVVCKVIACNIKRWWRATRASGNGPCPSREGALALMFRLLATLWQIIGGTASCTKYILRITYII